MPFEVKMCIFVINKSIITVFYLYKSFIDIVILHFPVKSNISWIRREIFRSSTVQHKLSKTVQNKCLIMMMMSCDFDVKDKGWFMFHLKEAFSWIIHSYFGQKQWFKVKMAWCISYEHGAFHFKSHSLTDCSSVNYWTIVMFLLAVWTLILMAPFHCRLLTWEQIM